MFAFVSEYSKRKKNFRTGRVKERPFCRSGGTGGGGGITGDDPPPIYTIEIFRDVSFILCSLPVVLHTTTPTPPSVAQIISNAKAVAEVRKQKVIAGAEVSKCLQRVESDVFC